MPKHDVLKDFERSEAARAANMKRLGLKGSDHVVDSQLAVMVSLLDRIEALEAKLK